jgi:hypothetical protein
VPLGHSGEFLLADARDDVNANVRFIFLLRAAFAVVGRDLLQPLISRPDYREIRRQTDVLPRPNRGFCLIVMLRRLLLCLELAHHGTTTAECGTAKALMSALGQKRTLVRVHMMSALPPKADMDLIEIVPALRPPPLRTNVPALMLSAPLGFVAPPVPKPRPWVIRGSPLSATGGQQTASTLRY